MNKITFLLFTILTCSILGQEKLTSRISEVKNDGVFQNSHRTTYTYDVNNNLSEENDFYWNSENESWVLNYTETYTYNNNNKATNILHVEYKNEQVVEQDRTINTYNQAGNITEALDQELQNGIWVNEYRVDFIYVNNRLQSGESYEWEAGEWIPSVDGFLTELFYNDNGKVIRFQVSANRNTLSEDDERSLYSYDANSRIIKEEFQEWSSGSWVADGETEYMYDANGNIINVKESFTDDDGTSVYEDSFSFDTTQLLADITHPFKDKTGVEYLLNPFGFVNKLTGSMTDPGDSRATYFYEGGATASVNEDQLSTLTIYPNPTTDFVTIQGIDFSTKSISVFNVLGKKIKTVSNNTVSLVELSSGIYVLKITTTDGKIATRRVVKK